MLLVTRMPQVLEIGHCALPNRVTTSFTLPRIHAATIQRSHGRMSKPLRALWAIVTLMIRVGDRRIGIPRWSNRPRVSAPYSRLATSL
jgi:hypothetical protein